MLKFLMSFCIFIKYRVCSKNCTVHIMNFCHNITFSVPHSLAKITFCKAVQVVEMGW